MRGEVESVNYLAFSNQLEAPTQTMNSRLPSRGRTSKSVNWARPLSVTSTQMKGAVVKRTSSRLKGKAFAKRFMNATDPCSASFIMPADKDHVRKELCGESSNSVCYQEKLNRVIGYSTTRCRATKNGAAGDAIAAAAAGPTGPSMEPKYCSKEGSNSKMQKRARNVHRGGEDKLDADPFVAEAGKQWISVPLDDMEGKEAARKSDDRMNSEVGSCKSSVRLPENRAKANEGGQNIGVCSFNAAWHENPEHSKKKSKAETYDGAYKELCQLLDGQKGKVNDMERSIHEMRENQLKKLRKEKSEIEANAALEHRRFRHENAQLSLKYSRILQEKLAVERDRDFLKNDFSSKLEKARENLRLEVSEEHAEHLAQLSLKNARILQDNFKVIEREKEFMKNEYATKLESFRLVVTEEHAKVVAIMTEELAKEQEKTCCQICFAHPRDAIILPCMHFQYCNECLREHQRRLNGCPTCRTKITGVLNCNLSIS